MAQGSKSRIVIWAIVGVMVVVAVILLVTRPKSQSSTTMDPAKFATSMTARMDKFAAKVDKARAAGGSADAFAKVDQEMTAARGALTDLAGLTDAKAQAAKRAEVTAHFTAAKKAYKDATGKEAGNQ